MVEVFEITQLRDASCPCPKELVRVAVKLNTGRLLTPDDVIDLRLCIRELRAYAGSQSRTSMIDLIQTARIKIEMAKIAYSDT